MQPREIRLPVSALPAEYAWRVGDARSLEQVQERIRQFRDERDWTQFHSPANLAAALSVEAGELLELFLWAGPEGGGEVLESRRPEVEDELADVLIQCLNFSAIAEIDVLEAMNRKIDRNAERYPVERSRGRATKYTEFDQP
jgi:NTP pyrophosphatase (non-canonical NTP hydrolase)